MKLSDIITKDGRVNFSFYRAGNLYYTVCVEDSVFQFPVPVDDIGDATFMASDKAIIFMRYIRKALDNKTFVKAV